MRRLILGGAACGQAHEMLIAESYPKETAMADDKSKIGGQDRSRVSLDEDYEVQYWSTLFGVSAAELRAAVHAVGNEAAAVERYLKKG